MKKEDKEEKKLSKEEKKQLKLEKKEKKRLKLLEIDKKKKITSFVWWFFWVIYLEMIYRIFIVGEFWSINTLYVLVFCIPWIVFFTIITSLLNSKINRVFNIIFTIFITILTFAQMVYYNFYTSMFSFFSLTNGTGQVMQFWQQILEIILNMWYVDLLVFVPLILYLIFNRRLFSYKRPKLLLFLILFLFMNCGIIGELLLIKYDKDTYSLDRLINKTHAPMLTINKTGLFTMEALDLERYIFGFEEEAPVEEEEEEEEVVIIEEKVEYNILNIDFDALINKTSNKTVKNMHKYFKTVQPTEKNEYTGMFKGKNVIFITAEGFDPLALDEKLTPTLYKIANNGFVFTNFYQPLYPVSTSDGEYLNLTGLIPKEGVWSFSKSSKNKMSMTYGNMFKNNGYTTYGFHNHTYKYYDRHKSHPNAGFTYIGCGNGLEKKMNCKHWPNSDNEMMQVTPAYYINKEPFATYYMTVSGHLNYNFYGNNMAYRNKKAVQGLKYSDAVKAYIATQIEFDKGMKTLLDTLEKAGKLDNTLIVIAPDHYPYGLKNERKEMSKILGINKTDKFENYHSTLIMYNPTIKRTVVDTVCSSIDIVPTLYNLFGLDYDSRLVMGRDIFSKEEKLVILSDRSWITDKGAYNSVNGKFKAFTNEKLDQDYIKKNTNIANKRFSMSALILSNDYYKKIGLK